MFLDSNSFFYNLWPGLLIVCFLFLVLSFYIKRKWQVLERLNIPHDPPSLLNIGHFRTFYSKSENFFIQDSERKKRFGPIYGFYVGLQPRIVIHDPNILRQIYVKQFSNFRDRQRTFNRINGRVMNLALTAVCGEHWKRIRHTISPFFSTSSLKRNVQFIETSSDRLVANLNKTIKLGRFEAKELFGRYSIEVISLAAFGVDIQCQDGPNSYENKQVKMVKKMFNVSLLKSRMFRLFMLFPNIQYIAEKFNYSLYASGTIDYFSRLADKIKTTMKDKQQVNDVMQMMLSNKIKDTTTMQHTRKGMTNEEIIANSVMMITGGYESTANALTFLAYNLATHKDAQTRVYREIQTAIMKYGGFTYDAFGKMKYLTMCINESLRLYSTVGRNIRFCENDTIINGVKIPKGVHVEIPVYGLSHDEEYWTDPYQFNPQRMEDMSKIDPMVFQPFGGGPRNCIGMRFAMMEIKMAICKILKEFELDVCDDTPPPPLEMTYRASMQPKETIYLRVFRR
ncbi:cytochrome P450 3A5-like isoform X2 [Clavelina lepadiformis]|uniref:cytochrome P450 3A5-like isoform X2 n=1 Tax=Clavelina lepadiformis TaxID=159417 RepID=UPI0040430F3A